MRIAAAVTILVIAAVAAFVWLRGRTGRAEEPASVAQQEASRAAGASSVARSGNKAVLKPDVPPAAPAQPQLDRDAEEKRRAQEQEKLAGLADATRDPPANAQDLAFFRRAQRIDSRYDGKTGLLRALGEQHPEPVHTRAGTDPVLTAWTDAPRAYPGTTMRVHVQLAGSAPVQLSLLRAFLSIEGPPQEVVLSPEGPQQWAGAVRIAKDLPRQGTQRMALVQISAAGALNGAPFEVTGGTGFTVNMVEGRLVRLERPRIDGGNLVLDAVLQVDVPGRWYVYAELRGPHGEPVASARNRMALDAGEARVPLLFGGAALREQGVDGPYTVHLARATRVEEVPPNETEPVLDALATPAWLATEFR